RVQISEPNIIWAELGPGLLNYRAYWSSPAEYNGSYDINVFQFDWTCYTNFICHEFNFHAF
ncbi:12031_t:CDS:1, partial [Cetraspora pellucida]